ncbi:3-isopropylmalate dehydratase small subunit [Caulobacter sp. BP25]|uniref:3-isopropylmalate dehydratase small subunit n=1 Tax=Caulobacter sp. BP25 TaxID=2048900 RepID=UPI000C12B045|nr:3-isopropylmalate dehydratase small subunit [Caulobacter sp. BP25]PHY19713.1 3-isopropylmalate dehydratase small subunit [Caulobacter sp. BP25]
MEPLTKLTGVAAPLIRANIDTDAIIPSREMKGVSKTGLADGLFAGWRYASVGGREPNPDFVLNDPAYAGVRFLLGGENFGCGSSREHAAWALAEYGFRGVLAPSFNPIFFNNCIRNGIAPVTVSAATIAALAAEVSADPQGRPLTLDMDALTITAPSGLTAPFPLAPEAQEMLRQGLDEIDLTLTAREAINAFREADKTRRPWIYA